MRAIGISPTVGAEGVAVDAGARWSKIVALVLLGFGVAFYLIFAVGETAGGDISGVQYFAPAAILAVLVWVAWRRPRRAGIVLLALAVPLADVYIGILFVRDLPLTWALVVAFPPILTGLLLLRAGRDGTRSYGTATSRLGR